jgi:hypothetical protein
MQFPQYMLITVAFPAGNQTVSVKTAIQKDSCISAGYKHGGFCIYGTTRS